MLPKGLESTHPHPPAPDLGMPEGWELKLDSRARAYFVNHTEKFSTYSDPRLGGSRKSQHFPQGFHIPPQGYAIPAPQHQLYNVPPQGYNIPPPNSNPQQSFPAAAYPQNPQAAVLQAQPKLPPPYPSNDNTTNNNNKPVSYPSLDKPSNNSLNVSLSNPPPASSMPPGMNNNNTNLGLSLNNGNNGDISKAWRADAAPPHRSEIPPRSDPLPRKATWACESNS